MAKISAKDSLIMVHNHRLSTAMQSYDLLTGYDDQDVAAFEEAVHNVLPALGQGNVTVNGVLDAKTSGDGQSHAALKSPSSNKVITVAVGQGATATVGDPAFSLLARQMTYQVNPEVSGIVPVNVDASNVSYPGDWGVLLTQAVKSVTNTHTSNSVDLVAQQTQGGVGYLHVVTAPTTDSYSYIIQDSTDNNTFATLLTFAANGQSTTSERKSVTGTVDRYVRARVARTGTAGETMAYLITFSQRQAGQPAPKA